jgi:peptidoglycan/xylan/chitin deacetylase (PgdA/CDA1 family)
VSKGIFLTFDDGPSKGTEIVRSILKTHGITATFFLTGSNAPTAGGKKEQKRILEELILDGHLLGNHCYVHAPATAAEYISKYGADDVEMTAQQRADFSENYNRNQRYFAELLGSDDFAFRVARLPGDGRKFSKLVKATTELGMRHYSWTFEFSPNGAFSWVPHSDWQGVSGVAASHAGPPSDKAIALLHGNQWKSKGSEFASLVSKLQDLGYSFLLVAT